MDTTKTFACALVALLLGASACSTGDETEAQIAELSARIVELEAEITDIKENITDIKENPDLLRGSKGDRGARGPQGATGPPGKTGPPGTGDISAWDLERCISDALSTITFQLQYAVTGYAGNHDHWPVGAYERGHRHDTTQFQTFSTPSSC